MAGRVLVVDDEKEIADFLSCRTDQGQRREAGASISVQERGQYLSRTNDSTVCK